MSREGKMAIIIMLIGMGVVAAVAPLVFDYLSNHGFEINMKLLTVVEQQMIPIFSGILLP